MKLRNLCLGIRDQFPLCRILKNLQSGNLLGLFHTRSHYTLTGEPKVAYSSKKSAMKAAKKMAQKKGVYFSNYKCLFCDGYHIGKNSE